MITGRLSGGGRLTGGRLTRRQLYNPFRIFQAQWKSEKNQFILVSSPFIVCCRANWLKTKPMNSFPVEIVFYYFTEIYILEV